MGGSVGGCIRLSSGSEPALATSDKQLFGVKRNLGDVFMFFHLSIRSSIIHLPRRGCIKAKGTKAKRNSQLVRFRLLYGGITNQLSLDMRDMGHEWCDGGVPSHVSMDCEWGMQRRKKELGARA